MNLFIEMLPLDISKKIMEISIQNLKQDLIDENTANLCYTLYDSIDGFQIRLYDLYADKKDIIYYLEKLTRLDAITVYIRTIITEWLDLVYYVDYDYYENQDEGQEENDMNVSIIRKYI